MTSIRSSSQRARRRDDRAVGAAHVAQSRRDATLGVGVDRRGRLDEDEELGVGEERARQGQPLALAAREAATALFDEGVEAVVEGLEDVDGARRLERGHDVAVGDVPVGDSSLRSSPEKSRGSTSLTTMWRRVSATEKSPSASRRA